MTPPKTKKASVVNIVLLCGIEALFERPGEFDGERGLGKLVGLEMKVLVAIGIEAV